MNENLEWARRNIPQVDKLGQAHEGSANYDHAVNNQWGSLLQIVVCQECEKDYKNIRHGTASHKIGFAIAILDALIDCEFLLTHCSLPQTTLSLVASPSILKE